MIHYPNPLVEAVILRRYKRFLADVLLPDGREVVAHCPNPGRMTSCWAPGAPCRVSPQNAPKRKLKWTLEQVCMGGTWVMVNTAMPNRVVGAALREGAIAEVAGYDEVRAEVRLGASRVDFCLEGGQGTAWVEVKSVTLLHEGQGAFPDAVSARGRRHLQELAAALGPGVRAVMLFLVGRSDVDVVVPAEHVDPAYARAFREAVSGGVEVLAYRCRVGSEGLELGERIPVGLTSRAQ